MVAAALDLIDTEGLGALSMRRVGQRLGVEAMSLYGHVAGREALLDAVVEAVFDDLPADPQSRLQSEDGWRDYLTRLAFGVRRVAMAHPRAFPVVATRPPQARYVRPPVRSLRWLDAFLGVLCDQGFSDEAVLYTYRAFSNFLLGHLLLEAGAMSAPDPGLFIAAGKEDGSGADLAGYPFVARFADRLAEDHAEREFVDGLDALLDRLARHPGVPSTNTSRSSRQADRLTD